MTVVDSEYCLIVIDVSANEREGDSTVFKESPFGKKLYSEVKFSYSILPS